MQRTVIWILNGLIAALSLLGILCYFFGPVWSIDVSLDFTSEEVAGMVGKIENVDLEEALGEDGLTIDLGLDIDMGTLTASFGEDADGTVQKIIDDNVDGIAVKLTASLDKVMQKVVTSLAKNMVRDKMNEQIRNYLNEHSDKSFSEDDILSKLEDAGLGEEFLNAKTEEIFNVIYGETNSSVDEIGDLIVGIVDEAYENLKKSDSDFENVKPLGDAQRESVKQGVQKVLDKFAAEDGTLDPDEILDGFMTEMLHGMNEKNSADVSGTALLAAQDAEGEDELKKEIKTLLYSKLPKEVAPILSWVLRISVFLVLISAAAWIYTIVKVVLKYCGKGGEPTVKLKLPILFGWLPFLILFCVPSLGLWILNMTPLAANGGILSRMSVSFHTIGWIALLCAGICLGISIYYMIVRKRSPRASVEAAAEDGGSDEEGGNREEAE